MQTARQQDSTKVSAGWNFDNSYARLPEPFFQSVAPAKVRSPKLVVLNRALAEEIGLIPGALETVEGIAMLSGNLLPPGATPIAQAYAGHQFGHFTMLGDGRAILLGEQITPSGQRVDLQLKGSGRTRFSRGGDGLAALGPMLREYIISEAMHALGVPTNRSLAVVSTGQPVFRETPLPGAVLTRVAASHIRVGTFEYAARLGNLDLLRALADYTISRHFPDLEKRDDKYLGLLAAVSERHASLIARWMQIGFIHGVMNTDNTSLGAETFDYGPCAFMDKYDPATVYSSIDHHGRYAFGNQPRIAQWNLARLAEALLPLIDTDPNRAIESAQGVVEGFSGSFDRHHLALMRAKMGLIQEEDGDISLIGDFLELLRAEGADYTLAFRDLGSEKPLENALFEAPEFGRWHERWKTRLAGQSAPEAEAREMMNAHNPAVVPRNHLVEAALLAARQDGDLGLMRRLMRVLSRPYEEPDETNDEYRLPPEVSDGTYRTFCGT